MSKGEDQFMVPVSFDVNDAGLVTLAFGPTTMDGMAAMFGELSTEEGQRAFLDQLDVALRAKVQEMEAQVSDLENPEKKASSSEDSL